MKKILIPFFISILLTACATAPGVSPPVTDEILSQNHALDVQPREDGMRTHPERNEFEWWYFDASFSDGSAAVIVFSTKSILNPRSKADPGVSIVITTSEGKKIKVSDSPGVKAFNALRDSLDVTVGTSFVKGDLSSCLIHFEKDDVRADLRLVSEAPAWRPGSGKLYFDQEKKEYFAWLAAIPYGTVEGTLQYNGKTVTVSGTGYHDHNWGNVRLDRVMTQWYWGRARIGNYTLIFSQMLTAPKYGSIKLPVFYLAKGNRILSKNHFDFSFKPGNWQHFKGGRDYPEEIVMDISQDNLTSRVSITHPVFMEAQYLLADAPWIVKILTRPFVNPWYYRFNADFTLDVDTSETKVHKTGTGIFEMMLLRGLQTVR